MDRLQAASPARPTANGTAADVGLPELQAVLGAYCLDRLSLLHLVSLRQASRFLVLKYS